MPPDLRPAGWQVPAGVLSRKLMVRTSTAPAADAGPG